MGAEWAAACSWDVSRGSLPRTLQSPRAHALLYGAGMRRWMLSVLLYVLFGLPVGASPITAKEIAFLVRQQTPDAELLEEVNERKISAPLTEVDCAALKQYGASPALIQKLRAPNLVAAIKEQPSQIPRAGIPPPNAQAAISAQEARQKKATAEPAEAYSTAV
jgi:hypothetical protein